MEFFNEATQGSFCPNCGGTKVIDENCPDCKFSFAEILVCPHREEGVCKQDETICPEVGMSWEACYKLREFEN